VNVGILTTSISRQSGGLLWAVRSLALNLSEAGCRVKIFAGKDSDTESDLQHWKALDVTVITRRPPKFFGYMPTIVSALHDAELDLLHTHGLWMYPSVAALRWQGKGRRPCVISPHGMLDPWALGNSAWKKRLAGWLYENTHLRRAACLHALCAAEYRAIRDYGLDNPVAVIPNGVDLPDLSIVRPQPEWAADLPTDSRVLLFLSRIHPKKGLTNLLHAWARVRRQVTPAAEPWWRLVIAGWDQGGHQAQLERLVEELGLDSSVHFVGPQFDAQKAASLARADAFVLPSLSEGLPMAVLEAWSYRLPVLMTPQCNLPEGFEAEAAIESAPEADSVADGLRKLFELSEAERLAMGEQGRRLVEQRFTWPTVAARMCAVYAWVLGRGPQPECVVSD